MKKILLLVLALVLILGVLNNVYAFSGRATAQTILYNYCENTRNCVYSCNYHSINGYTTDQCGSFTVNGSISSGNYIISQSLFSTQLQSRLLFLLKRAGFANDVNFNLSTAFVNYITPLHFAKSAGTNSNIVTTSRLAVMAGLSSMVSNGDLKPFNQLIHLFVIHFEKINK